MSIRSLAKNLPPDPDNKGWGLGWAVLKDAPAPWHLVDVYASKSIAEAEAARLNDGYAVRYGSHRLGSDDFVSGITPPK
ncbi:hypothetical protein [Pseudomonas tolaasii]